MLIFFSAGVAAVGQITAPSYAARVLSAALAKDARDAAREAAHEGRRVAQEEREAARENRDAAREARETAHGVSNLRKEALRSGERWNDPAMTNVRDTLRQIMDREPTSEALLAVIHQNETAVSQIMNVLEEISPCRRCETVDVGIMRDQFDFVLVKTWQTLVPWVQKQREQTHPAIWEDIERRYEEWRPRG